MIVVEPSHSLSTAKLHVFSQNRKKIPMNIVLEPQEPLFLSTDLHGLGNLTQIGAIGAVLSPLRYESGRAERKALKRVQSLRRSMLLRSGSKCDTDETKEIGQGWGTFPAAPPTFPLHSR